MKKLLLALSLIAVLSTSCTKNQRAKNFGGKATYYIDADKKFVNATWKDDNLWILTRDRQSSDVKEKYYFKEESSYGVMEGTIIFVER